jgi:two-component system, OmpR family, sensor histidine kinase MprB
VAVRSRWLQRVTVRTRIAVVAAAAVAVAVALASAASYIAVRRELLGLADTNLRRQANVIVHALNHPGHGGELTAIAGVGGPLQRSGVNSFVYFQVVRSDGEVFVGPMMSKPLPVTDGDYRVTNGLTASTIRSFEDPAFGGHVLLLTIGAGPSVAVQVATPLNSVDHTLNQLSLILILVAAGGVGMALLLGYVVAKTSMRPVERLTTAAEHVAATQDLDAAIEVSGDDELSRLAVTFNAMLAALAGSRRQQARLVADAGHELRTPLTSLRTNIEVLNKVRELPEPDRTQLMGDVTAQLEELTALIEDLVDLARVDEQTLEPEDVRLDAVVHRALERARRRAPALVFDAWVEPAMVRGQPTLLERAVLNVLDNAAKWSPHGAHVEVTVQREGSSWRVSVRDHGPGIAADDLPHVFDRFYRADNARALPGSGLGLAIVNQVIRSHSGWVAVWTPPEGGTVVTLTIPALDVTALGALGVGSQHSHE